MIVIKRKIFSIFEDKDKDGDYDVEDVKLQYKDWRQKRTGHPTAAAIIGSGVTAGAAYGGMKAGEKIATKKITKENLNKAKKVLIDKVKSEVKKGTVTKEQATKALKDPKKLTKLITKHGNLEQITKESAKTAGKRIKKAKIVGGIAAGLAPLAGTIAASINESEKRDKFLNNPKRMEVGYVKLVNKKKKKK